MSNNDNNNSINNNSLIEDIKQFKDEYYSNKTKNVFFKNSQKNEITKQITLKFNLKELIDKFTFIIPNTPNVFIDYTIFKLFANETNYQMLVEGIMNNIDICIQRYNEYNIHFNSDSITISATERHYGFIELYTNNCIIRNNNPNVLFTEKLNKFFIYNPPYIFDNIYKIIKRFIHKDINKKFIVTDKKDSKDAIAKLFVENTESNFVDEAES